MTEIVEPVVRIVSVTRDNSPKSDAFHFYAEGPNGYVRFAITLREIMHSLSHQSPQLDADDVDTGDIEACLFDLIVLQLTRKRTRLGLKCAEQLHDLARTAHGMVDKALDVDTDG